MAPLLGCLDFLLESGILNFFQCHLCRILLRLLLGITGAGTCRYPFDADFGVDEWHGHNAFIRDGERVFRTYLINTRGDEAMGAVWSYLDMTALGRQEEWEDSPKGYPQERPYKWWNWNDSYVPDAAPDPKWVAVSDAGEEAFRNDARSKT